MHAILRAEADEARLVPERRVGWLEFGRASRSDDEDRPTSLRGNLAGGPLADLPCSTGARTKGRPRVIGFLAPIRARPGIGG